MVFHVKFATIILVIVCYGLPFTFVAVSGGFACHDTHPDKVNIHLVPHTHDDVGWLKTVDQYYYGSNKGVTPVGVQYILDSVVSELQKNADRRFVYVETAYFWRWWEDLEESERESVRQLVFQGRLEFLLGGWCMSDEATPHYSAMIDQMTLGLKFLNETFGEYGRPNAAWQIDPFGHSSELGIEFAEMGYDAVFLGRIDYEDHRTRTRSRTMETIWRPDPSLGEAGDLFTSVLFDTYNPPPGFCFDVLCSDEPIMDNRKLHGYNVDRRIRQFEYEMKKYQEAYKTNHILITMGTDFMYSAASPWFRNIDKLIKYTNRLGNLNLLYSTPSCYLKALNDLNTTWTTKESDDFFPYASDEHSYWTGYYTSRPAFKYYVYLTNNILQAAKQLAVLLGDRKLVEEEFAFKRSVAIAQHHDGVSGTERQHVTDDYALYLDDGLRAGLKIFNLVYKFLYGPDYPEHVYGNLRNISLLEVSESGRDFVITIYNPLAHNVTVPVRFPISENGNYRVYNEQGASVQVDSIPVPTQVLQLPGRNGSAVRDVTFVAENVRAMGLAKYYVEATRSAAPITLEPEGPSSNAGETILDNGRIQLTFKANGLLYSITKDNVVHPFRQNFFAYTPKKGFNGSPENRASGAYIFRPSSTYSFSPYPLFIKANITKYTGTNVFEIHQTFGTWLSQVIRLYKNSDDVEFEWLIGPLPIRHPATEFSSDFNGMEAVTKYSTDIASNYTFYTDSNGRRWVERKLNHRKSWHTNTTEPVASNYYPLTTAIKIKDAQKQLTVIVDRPEGGASLETGEIEIMLHRRLLYDDDKGVAEPLDEHAFGNGLVVRGKHVIQLNENAQNAVNAHRLRTLETVYQPVVTFASTTLTLDEWMAKFNKSFSLISPAALPPNVHILTLERWRDGQLLLRLEHIFQTNESSLYSKPASVNLKVLFTQIGIVVDRFEELTLGANIEKKNLKRLKWNSASSANKAVRSGATAASAARKSDHVDGDVRLQPMEIKTFLLYVRRA